MEQTMTEAQKWLADELAERVQGMRAEEDSADQTDGQLRLLALQDLSEAMDEDDNIEPAYTRQQKDAMMAELIRLEVYVPITDEQYEGSSVAGCRKNVVMPKWKGQRYDFNRWPEEA